MEFEKKLAQKENLREILSTSLGKNLPSGEKELETPWLRAEQMGLNGLVTLRKQVLGQLANSALLEKLPSSLSFEQLEMLEAELRNQGILKKTQDLDYSLARSLRHETNIWSWRAERFGVASATLSFEVALPEYILARANDLLQSRPQQSTTGLIETPGKLPVSQSGIFEDDLSQDRFELQYLNSFARFLNGSFEQTQSKYQQGLNVVLHSLCNRTEKRESANQTNLLTLPLNKPTFFKLIRGSKN